jgi:hypothetical protein
MKFIKNIYNYFAKKPTERTSDEIVIPKIDQKNTPINPVDNKINFEQDYNGNYLNQMKDDLG